MAQAEAAKSDQWQRQTHADSSAIDKMLVDLEEAAKTEMVAPPSSSSAAPPSGPWMQPMPKAAQGVPWPPAQRAEPSGDSDDLHKLKQGMTDLQKEMAECKQRSKEQKSTSSKQRSKASSSSSSSSTSSSSSSEEKRRKKKKQKKKAMKKKDERRLQKRTVVKVIKKLAKQAP